MIIDRFHPLFGHVLIVYTRSRGSVADHAPESIIKTNLESIGSLQGLVPGLVKTLFFSCAGSGSSLYYFSCVAAALLVVDGFLFSSSGPSYWFNDVEDGRIILATNSLLTTIFIPPRSVPHSVLFSILT